MAVRRNLKPACVCARIINVILSRRRRRRERERGKVATEELLLLRANVITFRGGGSGVRKRIKVGAINSSFELPSIVQTERESLCNFEVSSLVGDSYAAT